MRVKGGGRRNPPNDTAISERLAGQLAVLQLVAIGEVHLHRAARVGAAGGIIAVGLEVVDVQVVGSVAVGAGVRELHDVLRDFLRVVRLAKAGAVSIADEGIARIFRGRRERASEQQRDEQLLPKTHKKTPLIFRLLTWPRSTRQSMMK